MSKCSETPKTDEQPCGCKGKKRNIVVTVLLFALPLGAVVAAAYWLYKQNKLKFPILNDNG